MARLIPAEEIGTPTLDGLSVAVIGYGNQGRAQALNLKDSGVDLAIGQRPGANAERADADGQRVMAVGEAAAWADVLMLTLPDETSGDIYRDEIASAVGGSAKTLLFSHGFAIHFGFIEPTAGVTVALVAPKGQAKAVRDRYLAGTGVAGLVAIHADPDGRARRIAYGYAHAAGYTRCALFETTFREETETDLFGEQAVLCGGIVDLMMAGYHTLVDAGYAPEMAYFECVHETKLIVDLIFEQGIQTMRRGISDTAEWGGYGAGKRLVDERTRQTMADILGAIQSGRFAQDWVAEARTGKPNLRRLRDEDAKDDIHRVGERLRSVLNR